MRRAFTLIELMVVTAVLVLLTTLVLPNVVGMKKSREHREAFDAALRLAQRGREAAITSGKTYTLTFSDGGSTISLQPDADSTSMSRDGFGGNGGSSSQMSASQVASRLNGDGSSDTANDESATASLAEGMTTGQMTVDGKSASANDFTLHFYPDGRSEGGGFEIVDGANTRHVTIATNGYATLSDGALPATAQSSWEAGQYAQRTSS